MKEISINLLRSQSVLSSTELVLLEKIKFFSVVMLIALLVSGIFVSGAFAAAQLRLNALDSERTSLIRRISLQARKEALLLSLKDRVSSLEKTLNSQYPWQDILNAVSQIAQPPQLQTLAIDQKNVLSLGLSLQSLEELQGITQTVEQLANQKKIREPVLDSLQSSVDGSMKLNIRFIPNF
jgi:hypothetical protein